MAEGWFLKEMAAAEIEGADAATIAYLLEVAAELSMAEDVDAWLQRNRWTVATKQTAEGARARRAA